VRTNFTSAARAPAVSREEEKENEATGSWLKTTQVASTTLPPLAWPKHGSYCVSQRVRAVNEGGGLSGEIDEQATLPVTVDD
jgi:hypothetical protein